MQKTLSEDKLVSNNIIISNKPGGGGATGWNYLKGKKGQGEVLAANSSLLLLNNLTGSSELTYKDFTPLAMLQTEWEVIAVNADSPYKTGKEFFDALKADPASIPVAVGPALANDDHLSFLEIAKAYGVDPTAVKFVVYPGAGGEEIPALLGGHVKAMTISLGEALEQAKAGKIRILGVSSDKRVDAISDVPTWKEQGADVVFAHWRGIMGPPDMTPEQIKYWDDLLGKMVQQDSWKTAMKNMSMDTYYMNSADTKAYLEKQNADFESILKQVGLIK
jgi:tripartite-type tricarboxylate transporter receptor subunit TctC